MNVIYKGILKNGPWGLSPTIKAKEIVAGPICPCKINM